MKSTRWGFNVRKYRTPDYICPTHRVASKGQIMRIQRGSYNPRRLWRQTKAKGRPGRRFGKAYKR